MGVIVMPADATSQIACVAKPLPPFRWVYNDGSPSALTFRDAAPTPAPSQEPPPHAPPQAPRPSARRLADHRQAAGAHQHRRGQPRPPRLRCAEGRARRHARSARHRRSAGRLRRGDQDRALRDGRHQALPLHPALRRGARHRRCGRQGHRHLACPPHRRGDPRRAAAVPRRHHADPADLLGGEGRRRARLRHGARGPPARAGTPPRPGGSASN